MKGSTETRTKASFKSFGKTDALTVNTKVFVSFDASSRRNFILRTFVTPCSRISSRISCSLTPFKSGSTSNALAGVEEAVEGYSHFQMGKFI